PVALPCPTIGFPTFVHVRPSSVERHTLMIELFFESWYETHALVPFVVIHWRSAPAVSSTCDVQPDGPVADAGQRVTETPSCALLKAALTTASRSASRIVPADVTSTSASSSPTSTRPFPWIGSRVSIAPKKAGGMSPKWPFQRLTWNVCQPSPSTAIVFPGPPKSIAGSLSPDELACGAVAGHASRFGTHGASRAVVEKGGGDAG